MMRSGATIGDRLQRGVARSDDFGVRLAAAFECVLDESRDVLLVFDDENLDALACVGSSVAPANFAAVSKMLIVG